MAGSLPDLAYDLDGFQFGTGSLYIVQDVDYGATEIITNDNPLPRADGIRFGRDYHSNRVLTFEIAVNQSPHQDGDKALALMASLETAWRADAIRRQPGAVSSLRLARNGRTRRVYGRPRKFASQSERSKWGWQFATCEFVTVDGNYYSDSENVNTVSIVPEQGGGLIAPLISPLTTLAVSYGPGDIRIGGTLPTWPVFVIQGPINKPKINVVGEWSFTLDISLNGDEWVAVDPRPWSRGVRKNGLTNVAGKLDANAPRLSDMRLAPGPHEIVLSGEDGSGTSQFTVAWRDTYSTY